MRLGRLPQPSLPGPPASRCPLPCRPHALPAAHRPDRLTRAVAMATAGAMETRARVAATAQLAATGQEKAQAVDLVTAAAHGHGRVG